MATLGLTTVGGTNDFVNKTTNNLQVFGPYTLAVTGSFTKISFYFRTPGTVIWYGYIYGDSAGTPAAFKGLTNQTTTVTADAFADATFASPVILPPATYWVGVKCGDTSAGNLFGKYDTTLGRHYATGTTSDGYTGAWSDAGSDNHQFSCYATYDVVANLYQPGYRFGFL